MWCLSHKTAGNKQESTPTRRGQKPVLSVGAHNSTDFGVKKNQWNPFIYKAIYGAVYSSIYKPGDSNLWPFASRSSESSPFPTFKRIADFVTIPKRLPEWPGSFVFERPGMKMLVSDFFLFLFYISCYILTRLWCKTCGDGFNPRVGFWPSPA